MVKVSMRVPDREQVLRMVDLQRTERGVVVIATETPVERYDEQRGLYKEVLLMSGVKFRGERRQIPIVDSHDDSTVKNVVGSVRQLNIDRDNGELYGEYVFSGDPDAKSIETKIKEGHVTDFSITALPLEGKWVRPGEVYVTERGESIEGPAHIITLWEPHNASVCATGADVNSVVRRSYTDLKRGERSMEAGSMPDLSSVGVPEGMTDPNQIIAFLIGKIGSMPMEPIESMVEEVKPDAIEPVESMASTEEVSVEKVENMDDKVKEEVARALATERKRRAEILDDCKLAKLDRDFADKLADSGVSADEARKQILRATATQTATRSAHEADFGFAGLETAQPLEGERFTVTGSSEDKFDAALKSGLVQRSFKAARIKADPKVEGNEFAGLSLKRMASAYVARLGAPILRMTDVQIARAAMGHIPTLRQFRIERDAWHTRGSFANLMLDAANKTLLAAYDEAPYTWSLWARQAASVDDFKNINRIRFSESPDLEAVPENMPYPEKSMSDSKETYSVQKYGAMFSVSWETVVNDDLDAISRVPAMHGNAARRTQNKKVYEVLTSNPTMSDTYSLFSASHASGSNQSGSAAAPAKGTLDDGFEAMMLQKGLNSSVVLGIMPRYLIVPANYSATALELVASTSYIVANGNSGVANIYGPNGDRPLTVVIESQLDAASTTNWYLAADPAQIDTVELTFLSGEESPVLESEQEFDTDSYKFKVRQTFGVKAIDWRGLYRNSTP